MDDSGAGHATAWGAAAGEDPDDLLSVGRIARYAVPRRMGAPMTKPPASDVASQSNTITMNTMVVSFLIPYHHVSGHLTG